MAPESNSWIPQGTHEVQIGPSLNKALKARKGGPPPQVKRTGPPEKDFLLVSLSVSSRYNRKPPSLDTTKPGTIEVSRGKGPATVVVEHPSSQPGETHVYTGTETSAPEVDCVLTYDEETGSTHLIREQFYKLEKLESYIGLNYERKSVASVPQSAASTPAKIDTDTDGTRLSMDRDAEGEIDDELPSHFQPKREEEEEEEEEDLEPVPPVKAPPAPKPAAASTSASASTSRPTKPAPQRKATTKKAQPPPAPPTPVPLDADGDADEEHLEFGRPTTKRAKQHAPPPPPPAPAPVAFSLPGPTSGWVPPPAPPTHGRPAAPASPIPLSAVDDSDEDEEDWDEVPAAPIAGAQEDWDEEDLELLERTLEEEMADATADGDGDGDADGYGSQEEEDDFLADVLPQAPDSAGDGCCSRCPRWRGTATTSIRRARTATTTSPHHCPGILSLRTD
ncbi:hypothetical protein B0H14DRAFT_3619163 [Mycena olivaceomarginata]|nr:hypothetical protein B0H14DRAFT_3619163 [Mycena olivaceomarginata]